MSKNKSLIKFEGTHDELTFYHTKDGHLVRTKGGISKERILNDPNFRRTRENGLEFGNSARSGKLLRQTVRKMLVDIADGRVTSRITKIMTLIKNNDTTSERGDRSVAIGINDPKSISLLKGFDFNENGKLNSVLFTPYVVDVTSGEIVIDPFVPVKDLSVPAGATHVMLKSAMAKVDFSNNTSDIAFSESNVISINNSSSTIKLTPNGIPEGDGIKFYLLRIEFLQETNGQQFALRNVNYNAVQIVEVVN